MQRLPFPRITAPLAALLLLAACGDDPSAPPPRTFFDGTVDDPGIAWMLSSTNKSLLLLQTGAPNERREIPLGTSTTITPTSAAMRGRRTAIPLGNAASVAIGNLETETLEKYYTFAAGNATGAAWVDDSTVIVANQGTDVVGRIRTNRPAGAITDTVAVTPFPTGVLVRNGRVFVISSNLDDTFSPAGEGVVTEINPATMAIVRTISTGGDNPQYGAFAPDGKLYVTNSGSFGANDGSVAVINLTTNTREAVVDGFGNFPGEITIDAQGRAIISSFSIGSVVWNTATRTFIRSPANPLCAPNTAVSGSPCRGASGAAVGLNGRIYQSFFGSASAGLPAYLFVYDGTSYALTDSIPVPTGPAALTIQRFER